MMTQQGASSSERFSGKPGVHRWIGCQGGGGFRRSLSGIQVVLLCLLLVLITGCEESTESTRFGHDRRDLTNPVQNQDPGIYQGRVMNGNLENALVWLDLESNGRLSDGDPWGVSDGDGRFELDISGLAKEVAEARSLNPRDFSLMALAIPGETIDHHSGETIDKAFFLLAPPGRVLISTFSTLVEAHRRQIFRPETETLAESVARAATDVRQRTAGSVEELSLLQDYQVSDSPRTAFYAEALRRFYQAQIPEALSARVPDWENPDVVLFNQDSVQVIGSLALDQIGLILAEVDALIDVRGLEGFRLPPADELATVTPLNPDLNNPLLLWQQQVYLPPEDTERSLTPENAEEHGQTAARVFYHYDVATLLRGVNIHGQSWPNLPFIATLANQQGHMASMGRQPWLEVMLDEESLSGPQGVVQERLLNSGPDNGRIPWHTLVGDSQDFNVDLDSAILNMATATLDGLPDRVYRVTELDGQHRVKALERRLPAEGDGTGVDSALAVSYGDAALQPLVNLPQVFAGDEQVAMAFGEVVLLQSLEGCEGPEVSDDPGVINARQVVALTGAEAGGNLVRYGHWRKITDAVNGSDGLDSEPELARFRVIVERFDPVDGGSGRELRELEYFDYRHQLLRPDQPDLLRSVRLFFDQAGPADSIFCNNSGGSAYALQGDGLDAYLHFDYLTFSEYLGEQGTGN